MHNFNQFPELTNAQAEIYYFESPHKQIFEDFRARVEKVHDGDSITVSCDFRDFVFPIRIAGIDAPELSEAGGHESRDFLKPILEGEEVDVILTPERVEKWGRLLAGINHMGIDIGEMMINNKMANPFETRHEGKILPLEALIE